MVAYSRKLNFPCRKQAHAYQQPSVTKTTDLRGAVFSVFVADNHFGNFQVEFCGAKQQIKVAKWVKFTEILAVGFDG